MTDTARLIVTGSRNWTDDTFICEALNFAWFSLRNRLNLRDATLVHGSCPTGADAIADKAWTEEGRPVERHPADWATHGRAAGPIRNQRMVDLGADLVLAFPLGESRGTRHCIRVARAAGLPVWTFEQGDIR